MCIRICTRLNSTKFPAVPSHYCVLSLQVYEHHEKKEEEKRERRELDDWEREREREQASTGAAPWHGSAACVHA